jgi:hypothetical protein
VAPGLAGLCACGLLQELRPSVEGTAENALIEVDRVQYDGEVMQFRLVLGAADAGVVIDRRIIENVHVTMDAVRDCAEAGALEYLFVDHLASPPTDKDLLALEPGYWFGSNLRYPLFPRERFPDGGPPCIDADFSVRPEPWRHQRWRILLTVRAERTARDAGAETSPDAGQ